MTTSNRSTPLVLKDCTILGGSGFPFSPGDTAVIVFNGDSISCKNNTHLAQFSMLELADVSITGPGTVVKGGGFIGGGFGVEGALGGMAIAGVLNALTTAKSIHTYIALTTNFGELHLHYGAMEPGALRVFLSDVFVNLRRMDRQWVLSREQLIDAQLANGAVSEGEANEFRSRLVSPPVWPALNAEAEAQRLLDEKAADAGPKGLCPSCDKTIPLRSDTCKYCKANFGQYSSWQVIPVG